LPISLFLILLLLSGGFAIGGLAFPARSTVFYGVALLLLVVAFLVGRS